MTSSTFARVRLFTDIEDITLDKWLGAENAGQDELARKILDAGLLVEHMIAEIPLDQNLADNSELKQLTDSADRTFGLIVCFDCNRAFQSKNDQASTCPNCGAQLARPDLTPTNLGNTSPKKTKPRHSTAQSAGESHDSHLATSTHDSHEPKKQSTPVSLTPTAPSNSPKNKRTKKQVRIPSAEKHARMDQASSSKNRKPGSKSKPSDEPDLSKHDSEEGWFGDTSPIGHGGKQAVKTR